MLRRGRAARGCNDPLVELSISIEAHAKRCFPDTPCCHTGRVWERLFPGGAWHLLSGPAGAGREAGEGPEVQEDKAQTGGVEGKD